MQTRLRSHAGTRRCRPERRVSSRIETPSSGVAKRFRNHLARWELCIEQWLDALRPGKREQPVLPIPRYGKLECQKRATQALQAGPLSGLGQGDSPGVKLKNVTVCD